MKMWTNLAAPSEWVSGLPVLTACKIGGKSSSSSDIDRAVCEMVGGGESFYLVDESALRCLSLDVVLTEDVCEVCAIDLATVKGIVRRMNVD